MFHIYFIQIRLGVSRRPKSTLYLKNYFTVETSIFVEKNLYKFRFLFGGKDRFVIKNTSVNTENEVLSSKRVLYI